MILYDSPIFGPVHSRRLGISLGINLLPADGKWCSFDCIYCECGLNKESKATAALPTKEAVGEKLREKGFSTTDTLHYTEESSKLLYELLVGELGDLQTE